MVHVLQQHGIDSWNSRQDHVRTRTICPSGPLLTLALGGSTVDMDKLTARLRLPLCHTGRS